MMKVVSFLLSLYFFSLTLIPCVDEIHGMMGDHQEMCTSLPSDHHSDIDHCSPFCDCNCCGNPIISAFHHYTLQVDAVTIERQTYFDASIPVIYSAPTWHPPKQA